MLVAASTASAPASGGGSSNCYWLFPIPSWTPTANVTVGGSDAKRNYLIVAVQDGVIQMHARLDYSFKDVTAAGTFTKTLQTKVIPSWVLPVPVLEPLYFGGYPNYVSVSKEPVANHGIYQVEFQIDASGSVKMQVETRYSDGTFHGSSTCEVGMKLNDMLQVTSGTRMN